jgi:hypothetical protein
MPCEGVYLFAGTRVTHDRYHLSIRGRTAGYRLAFAVAIGFALVGVVIALVFLGEMDTDQDSSYKPTSETEGIPSYPLDSENDD